MSIYVPTDIIPLGVGKQGGRGKKRRGKNNIITSHLFPVMKNKCSSYFFHAGKI